MSLFRFVKYSSILFFLGKYKIKLFRVIAVLIFAFVTSILYQDVANFLQQQYPDTVVYALIGKIIIVYGALIFVLLQFRPEVEDKPNALNRPMDNAEHEPAAEMNKHSPSDRLAALEDVSHKDILRTRYDGVIEQKPD